MSEEIKVGDRFQWGAKIWRIIGKRCASDSWDVNNEVDGEDSWMTSGWIRRHCTRLPPKEEFKPGDRFAFFSSARDNTEIVLTLDSKHRSMPGCWWTRRADCGDQLFLSEEVRLQTYRRIEPEVEMKAGARFQNVNTDVVWVLVRFVAEAPPRWLTVKEDPLGGDRVITVAQLQDRQMHRRLDVSAEEELADKEFEVMRQVEFNKGDKQRQDAILTQMLAPLDVKTFLLRGR